MPPGTKSRAPLLPGGTLLGGMGGEYGLYLLLLAWTLLALAWLAACASYALLA